MSARSFALGVLAALLVAPGVASAATPVHRYYLALGDSLSQGVQPDSRGASLETDQGYADQLARIERQQVPNLRLVKLGCPGDTTASMLTGHGRESTSRTGTRAITRLMMSGGELVEAGITIRITPTGSHGPRGAAGSCASECSER